MSLCCIQAAASKVFLDELTKLSAAALNKNNNVKREDDTRVTSLSFGISQAAGGLRNRKCNFSPSPRTLLCRLSQLEVADLAPSTSAAYGILLLGGGLFAFAKSASKGSLFGGLTGAALMASHMTKGGVCLLGKVHEGTQMAILQRLCPQLHGWFWLGFRFQSKWSLSTC